MRSMVLTVVLLAAAPLQAQQTPQTPPTVGDAPLGVPATELDSLAIGQRASKLLGAPVFNAEGQRIGKVTELVVAHDRSLVAAIVDVGAFLGGPSHLVAFPLAHLTLVKNKLTIPGASKDALKKAPEFKFGKESTAPA